MKTIFLVGIGFIFVSLLAFFVVPNALAGFHVFGGGGGQPQKDITDVDPVNPDNVEQLADEYYSAYQAVIDDMLTFQKKPDYKRAEAQRQAVVNQAQELIPKFKALASKMRSRLDLLSEQATDQAGIPIPVPQQPTTPQTVSK